MNVKINSSLLAILLWLASCGQKKQEAAPAPKRYVLSDTMQHMIQLGTVDTSTLVDQLVLSGSVDFNENNVVNIFPRSSGQIVSTQVSLGDYVRKGKVLAVIRSAEVAGSYSELSSAHADLAIAKRTMESVAQLYQNGISSEREYTDARQNYQKAAAQVERIEAAIRINGGSGASGNGNYNLTSPIEGYVVAKNAAAGAFIRPDDGKNIFTVSDLRTVWVNANVYESDIARVKQGYAVRIIPMAYPDKVLEGHIEKVGDVLDPENKSMTVRISLPNTDMLLKPEMFVKVIVVHTEGIRAISIPTAALLTIDGKHYVIAYHAKDNMEIVSVPVLQQHQDRTFIPSGILQPGQQLITKYQSLIFEELQQY